MSKSSDVAATSLATIAITAPYPKECSIIGRIDRASAAITADPYWQQIHTTRDQQAERIKELEKELAAVQVNYMDTRRSWRGVQLRTNQLAVKIMELEAAVGPPGNTKKICAVLERLAVKMEDTEGAWQPITPQGICYLLRCIAEEIRVDSVPL